MLRPFKYVNSLIEALHSHVEEIVELWCSAEKDLDFDLNLIQNQDLKNLIEALNDAYLATPIEAIYKAFQEELDENQRKAIKANFVDNNQIEELCKGNLTPIHYHELPFSDATKATLRSFFDNLYKEVLNREPFYGRYEKQKAHFDKLCEANDNNTICPFCGLNDLQSQFHKGRDAYDHYLPKSKYPFTIVNFYNLVPICHPCNSGNKSSKDPLYKDSKNKTGRRKTFFPYSVSLSEIGVAVKLQNKILQLDYIQDSDIEVVLNCTQQEELETWDDLFNIKERYKAKIQQKIGHWSKSLIRVYEKRRKKDDSLDFSIYVKEKIEDYETDKMMEQNFLRYAVFQCLLDDGILIPVLEKLMVTK